MLNNTGQKTILTNADNTQTKHNPTQIIAKQNYPGLVALGFYDTRPGNEVGSKFYNAPDGAETEAMK